MAASNSPCAACKFLRRKCTQECVFAPYFPPDHPQKFAYVHRVFGASNVSKLLNELASNQREDAVNSLYYEAEARLRDPVYGCVGLISILQHRHKEIQAELESSRKDLATYVGPQAMVPILQPHFMSQQLHHMPMMSTPSGQSYHEQQQQHIFEAQQLAEAAREQHNEMFRAYGEGGSNSHHQNQHQAELLRFNDGFASVPTGSVRVTGSSSGGARLSSPSLALGGNFGEGTSSNDNYYTDHRPQEHHDAKLFISSQPLPQETQTQTHPNFKSEEEASFVHLSD